MDMLVIQTYHSILEFMTWADFGSSIFFMLLGAVVSFYATIVFERYKRFNEILREIATVRLHFEGYPLSVADLPRAHAKAMECWHFLEQRQWELDAEGHHHAAGQVGVLGAFTFRVTACIEKMLTNQQHGMSIGTYLQEFQSEYGRIKDEKFIRFEETLKPNAGSLLQPFPQSVLPTKREQVIVDFFNSLL